MKVNREVPPQVLYKEHRVWGRPFQALRWPRLLSILKRAALHVVLLFGAAVMLFPFVWMLSSSLKDASQIFQFPPKWIPDPIVWENYPHVWDVIPLTRYYGNSIFVASTITISQLITAALAAYVFARLRFPGRDAVFLLFLATMMIPEQVTMIPTYILLAAFGWVDTYKGVIVPAMVHPFGIFMLRQFFVSIPGELEDAARIDGSSRLGTLFRIILPLSTAPLASLAVFIFMWHWNSFLWPLIVLNTESKYTLPVGLAMLRSELGTDWPTLMAAMVLATLPVIALFLVAQKQFVKGIALTGLKA